MAERLKDLVSAELKFAKYEFQLKAKGSVDEERLRAMGAKLLGTVSHEDKYYVPKGVAVTDSKELVRVRKEGSGHIMFTYKGPVKERRVRTRLVLSKPMDKRAIDAFLRDYSEVITVNKTRRIFLLNSVIVNADSVDNVGDFVEFEVDSKDKEGAIFGLMSALGLNSMNSTKLSYFELALMNTTPLQRLFTKVNELFGGFSFGISSAVLTTLGVIVGLDSATTSRLAVIGGIAAVAIADSFSDAMGMYAQKKSERNVPSKAALASAVYTFIGKFVFTSSFLLPFLLLPLPSAVAVSLVWGFILLSFVNSQIAFVQGDPLVPTLLKNTLFAAAVIVISYVVGGMLSTWI